MRTFFLTLGIGVIAGIFDILPMLRMKMDRYSIASAFLQYMVVTFFIFYSDLPSIAWWAKGAVVSLILVIPVILLVMKEDKGAAIPMLIMSLVLGTLIGLARHKILGQ